MKMKLLLIAAILCSASKLFCQVSDNCVANVILSSYSERAYSSVPVTDLQLDVILKCGIKAPSARNLQPWKFTVIKDEAVMKEIISDAIAGNVLIIVSEAEGQGVGTSDFDCGLATESMFVAAHGLGLGARIYASPAGNVNTNREHLQVPAGYKAIVVLRVGNIDKGVDAVSSATPRKKVEEVVNYFNK
jgi:nitroreductase